VTNLFLNISSISLISSDLTRHGEQLINNGLNNPTPLTILIVFTGGLLTSLGPCSLSLLPITVAYLAGFKNNQKPLQKTISFCSGIVISLVVLGSLSGFLGKIYGQLPSYYSSIVALIAIIMGLNLLGILKFRFPNGPDLKFVEDKVHPLLTPFVIGTAFGFASSPCITPVLATLLAWVSQSKSPAISILFLSFFGLGQVIPLIIAGATTESLKQFLEIRKYSQIIPLFSGIFLISIGVLNLISNWI